MGNLSTPHDVQKSPMASHAIDGVRSCPRAGCGKSARPVVCPAKAGMFSRRKACRGGSTGKSIEGERVTDGFVVALRCSDDFSSGRGGLLQLLGMSLSPCCRFHPAEVLEPHRSDFGSPCCLRPPVGGSAFGATHFRGHFCVHCCYGPVTRRLPMGDVVDRLQKSWFPATLLSKLRGSDCSNREHKLRPKPARQSPTLPMSGVWKRSYG